MRIGADVRRFKIWRSLDGRNRSPRPSPLASRLKIFLLLSYPSHPLTGPGARSSLSHIESLGGKPQISSCRASGMLVKENGPCKQTMPGTGIMTAGTVLYESEGTVSRQGPTVPPEVLCEGGEWWRRRITMDVNSYAEGYVEESSIGS